MSRDGNAAAPLAGTGAVRSAHGVRTRPDGLADAVHRTPCITADALVVAAGPATDLDAVGRRVLAEAARPLTVTELADRLGANAVQARAVVGELWATGHLAVTTSPDAVRELHMLRRVLVGLREYS